MMPLLQDEDLEEIRRIGLDRRPCEALGLLLPEFWGKPPRRVWEMPNRSQTPHDQSQMLIADLRIALGDAPRELLERAVIWHTHPGGNVGPSRDDLRSPLVGMPLLVVALTKTDEAIPTLYEALGARA